MVLASFSDPLCQPGGESVRKANSQATSLRENELPFVSQVRPVSKQGQHLTGEVTNMVPDKGLGVLFGGITD